MKDMAWRVVLAGFLILLGVLILVSNLNLVPWDVTAMQWFWLLAFGGAGVSFLAVFLNNRENWWAIIPAFTLLGLAILVSNVIPERYEDVGAAVFLGMIGLSFWAIFFLRREFWWAIIPGGVLTTLALVVLASGTLGEFAGGAFFFLGLAATFLIVYFMPTQEGRMYWAIWPAGVLGVIGVLLTLGAEGVAQYIFPAALILLGGWMVSRALARRV
jgi:hypothetical protein